MIKYLEDARTSWSECQSRHVKHQWMFIDGICKEQCKAVTIVKKLIELRISSR